MLGSRVGRRRSVAIQLLAPISVTLVWTEVSPSRNIESAQIRKIGQPTDKRGTPGAAYLPDFMADVKSSGEVLMGAPGNHGDTFNLVAPVATGTESDRPRFEWQPLAGADRYTVTVFDERLSVIVQGAAVTQTNWEPSAPAE